MGLRQNNRIRGKNPKDRIPQKSADQDQSQTGSDRIPKHEPGDPPDRLRSVLPPILGADHDQAVADCNGRLLHNKKDLIDHSRPRQGFLPVGTQHDIVGHIHAVGDDVLQRHDHQHGEQIAVKVFVMSKKCLFHQKSPHPGFLSDMPIIACGSSSAKRSQGNPVIFVLWSSEYL